MSTRITMNINEFQDTQPDHVIYDLVFKDVTKPTSEGFSFTYVESNEGEDAARCLGMEFDLRGYPDLDAAKAIHIVYRCTQYASWDDFRAFVQRGLDIIKARDAEREAGLAQLESNMLVNEKRKSVTRGRLQDGLDFLDSLGI